MAKLIHSSEQELEKYRFEFRNLTTVLVHGCFDFFHLGHLHHLIEAKSLGDILMVSITSDRFVNKGPNRPIFNEEERAEFLCNINCVDYVIINNYADPLFLLAKLKPSFYAKGVDYRSRPLNINDNLSREVEFATQNSIKVIFTSSMKRSTTEIIDKIKLFPEP